MRAQIGGLLGDNGRLSKMQDTVVSPAVSPSRFSCDDSSNTD